MATFQTDKFIDTNCINLKEIAKKTKTHFENSGYTVHVEENAFGQFISISKGGIFKSILGMKTALNIEIKETIGGISVSAKVGIFGQQLIPSAISLFIAWPVLLTQISGLVKQSKLDDEAIQVVEEAVHNLEVSGTYGGAFSTTACAFCTACGSRIAADAAFCSRCGAKQSH
jgi:hypothetical protein